MTNPNPLIITNKFPSWIIQDKNQPPFLASQPPRHLTDSGWFISVFWRKHPFLHFTPTPDTVPSQGARQMVRGPAFILTEKGNMRQKERVAVVVTLCHLSCVIWPVSSPGANHRVSLTWPAIARALTHISVSPANPAQPGARVAWTYFESDYQHILLHAGAELLPGWPSCLSGARARQ